jgi:hypothetical protein
MQTDVRRRRFRSALTPLVGRAEVTDSELAARVGVTRATIFKWRHGTALPRDAATVWRLKAGLRWSDMTGTTHELTDDELGSLLNAGGFQHSSVVPDVPSATPTDRCIVYTNRYAPSRFPSRWSMRIIELEKSIPGSIRQMWNTLPSVTRNTDFYVGAYSQGLYDQANVEAYMAAHEARQEEFIARMRVGIVQHLYSADGVTRFLENPLSGLRPPWDTWSVSRTAIAAQLHTVLQWLEDPELNFEIRLREPGVPGNLAILGHDVVIVEYPLAASLQTGDNINGLEIVGAAAVTQFMKQFDSYWADRATVKTHAEVVRWFKKLYVRLSRVG